MNANLSNTYPLMAAFNTTALTCLVRLICVYVYDIVHGYSFGGSWLYLAGSSQLSNPYPFHFWI
jgi:hypothetical protein